MKNLRAATTAVVALLVFATPIGAARTLDIYFIDVEGGQSTLVVTPSGGTLLIDTGYPSDGTFRSRQGDPSKARDANRIAAVAKSAGVTRLDYVLITHFHGDHAGGVVELSQLLPIRAFVDHDNVLPEAEQRVAGTQAIFDAYADLRKNARHIIAKPGDRLPMNDVEIRIVSSAGRTILAPLSSAGLARQSSVGAKAGQSNSACTGGPVAAEEPTENPRSTGFRLRFGRFTFLDLGDLSGDPLHALACPRNLVGPVDVYLVAHHGGIDSANAATFAAFKPRTMILNNGATKGGAPETFAMLQRGGHDVWQLHRSTRQGSQNFANDRIANLNETTAHWIKASASPDGSFTVTNGRTGQIHTYP
jgi:competence protein ComEC